MKEVLFKGQRVYNGDWVYGSLSIEYDNTCFISNWVSILIDPETNSKEMVCKKLEVKTETISQFTGLLDKNGNKIFEGNNSLKLTIIGIGDHFGDVTKMVNGQWFIHSESQGLKVNDTFKIRKLTPR